MTQPPPSSGRGDRSVAPANDEVTGLPWPRTWRGVYWFVFASFVSYVVLLTWLTRAFS